MTKKEYEIYYNTDPGIDTDKFTDLPEEVRERAKRWIYTWMVPAERPYKDNTSYGLKHLMQDDIGLYMTNNQFKEAMKACGFEKVEKYNALNCTYRLDKEVLKALRIAMHRRSEGRRLYRAMKDN